MMKSLDNLINTCKAFKDRQFNIREFQNRLETINLPDEFKKTVEADRYNAINKLEEIQFCYDESHQKTLGDEVADTWIQAALSATSE